MRQEREMQNAIIAVLAVAVLVMSVGFAVYSQTLNINGTATFTKAKWDVHFDTTTWSEVAGDLTATHTLNNTTITYTVTLGKPGDVYTFSVDAKNFGTIDATLTGLTMTGLTTEQSKYASYVVEYNDVEYTESPQTISEDLLAGESHTVTVTVTYLNPADPADLPTDNDAVLTLTLALDYEDMQ